MKKLTFITIALISLTPFKANAIGENLGALLQNAGPLLQQAFQGGGGGGQNLLGGGNAAPQNTTGYVLYSQFCSGNCSTYKNDCLNGRTNYERQKACKNYFNNNCNCNFNHQQQYVIQPAPANTGYYYQ
jgi:hypothetical protein